MTKARCNNHKDSKTLPIGCVTCRRIQLEATIVKKTVKVLLDAGYKLRIDDSESVRPREATDSATTILAELMETDDEYMEAFKDGKRSWVRFVYGNDGYDVISDYTVDLEDVLQPVNAYTDKVMNG